jgi:hypothetical protein
MVNVSGGQTIYEEKNEKPPQCCHGLLPDCPNCNSKAEPINDPINKGGNHVVEPICKGCHFHWKYAGDSHINVCDTCGHYGIFFIACEKCEC